VNQKQNFDKTIENAFAQEAEEPGDKYFKKIWDSIESRAPVGERYYLRYIFSALLFLLFITVFLLFYTDFLSSVLILKEIRHSNNNYYNTGASSLTPPIHAPTPGTFAGKTVAQGVKVIAREKSSYRLKTDSPDSVELQVFNGHLVVEKQADQRLLLILLPNLILSTKQGRCNIFCYDSIIRIIPLTHPVTVRTDRGETVVPVGAKFHLLDKKEILL